jgi:hypothetical protein
MSPAGGLATLLPEMGTAPSEVPTAHGSQHHDSDLFRLVSDVVVVARAHGIEFPQPDGSEPVVVLLRMLGRIAERTVGLSIPIEMDVAGFGPAWWPEGRRTSTHGIDRLTKS